MQAQTTRPLVAAQAASVDASYLDEVFGNGGLLARDNDGYSERPEQRRLALLAHNAFSKKVPTAAEGPCGTGKGLAYLVPGIRHATATGGRLLVATATNALLEQLLRKELPTLQRVLPWKFTFGEAFGRSNYLCREKEANFQPSLLHPRHLVAAKALKRYALTTQTGKKDDAPQESLAAWEHVSVSPDECTKPRCKVIEHCFAEKARKHAEQATVVVTNMHMLALNVRYRGMVLPAFDYLVIDEAHELPDIARDFFGERVTWSQAKKLLRACEAAAVDVGRLEEGLYDIFKAAVDLTTHPVDTMFDEAPRPATADSGVRSARIEQTPGMSLPRVRKELYAALQALQTVSRKAAAENKKLGYTTVAEEMVNASAAATRLIDRFARVLWPPSENTVRWVEVTPNGTASIHAQPVDAGPMLRTALFDTHPATFITSATLAVEGTFDFISREIGAPKGTICEAVPSPFDFEKQAMMVVPRLPLPDVDEEGWAEGVQQTLLYVIRVLDGRTMALFTSGKRMRAAAEYLRSSTDVGQRQILVQGEDSSRALTDQFKADERSVLLGTRTFWTGIDAAGDTLCALLIDRLPMLQDTPQVQAIKGAYKARNDALALAAKDAGKPALVVDFFSNYYVPKSAQILQQGVGRLIRSKKDVGVIVCCDGRLLSKPYGRTFLRSLPKMEVTQRLGDIPQFLQHARAVVRR